MQSDIHIRDLQFSYPRGGFSLNIPQLDIERGTSCALTGPSGTGKTTLLKLIAGILTPSSGRIGVTGTEIVSMSDAQRRLFRLTHIGYIFQDLALLDYLSARDNILLPYRINRSVRLDAEARNRAEDLAQRVGLTGKLDEGIGQLSQGQQQRIAVCRALITCPRLLLADEPTSDLDPGNSDAILDIMLDTQRQQDATLIMLTHDPRILDRFDRVIDIASLATPEDMP
jgi:putative ABC transport system ATP-binding protein